MSPSASSVTRAEFEMLTVRVDHIDERGADPAGRAVARLDALTEELANLRTELAAGKQRQSANRRWATGAIIAGTAAVSAIVTTVAAVIFNLH